MSVNNVQLNVQTIQQKHEKHIGFIREQKTQIMQLREFPGFCQRKKYKLYKT